MKFKEIPSKQSQHKHALEGNIIFVIIISKQKVEYINNNKAWW